MMDTGVVALAEAKMRGVIDKGLDRLERLVEVSSDPGFVLETTDKLLGRMGYGPKTGPAIQINTQNNYAISRDVLEQARGMITGGRAQGEEVLEVLAAAPAAFPPEVKWTIPPIANPSDLAIGTIATGEKLEVQYPQNPFRPKRAEKRKLIVPIPPLRRGEYDTRFFS